jgi:hypothetical protein
MACLVPCINNSWYFGNYSILCSFQSSLQQFRHIDSLDPNWQFVIAISRSLKPTLVYHSDSKILTIEALLAEWGNVLKELCSVLKGSADVVSLVKKYGPVLSLKQSEVSLSRSGQTRSNSMLSVGDLLAIPGSVVHAGPATCYLWL